MTEHDRLNCRAAMAQLWDYLDEELTEDRMEAVKEHLSACRSCLPHEEFAKAFLDAIGSCRPEGEMPAEVRARVMRRLRDEGLIATD